VSIKDAALLTEFAWMEEFLPNPRKMGGQWSIKRKLEDGAVYDKNIMTGNMYVIFYGRFDDQGRRWLTVMASFQATLTSSRAPTWDEMRELKNLFFGAERAECIIPVLPISKSMGIAPAVLHMWRCLDGSVFPTWPSLTVEAPAMSEQDVRMAEKLLRTKEGD
jgi:hypothetical protein